MMPMYIYEKEKPELFKEENQKTFLSIRDRVYKLCTEAGGVSMGAAIRGHSGSSWFLMACVDRLIELGELREVTMGGVEGQYRVFTLKRSSQ